MVGHFTRSVLRGVRGPGAEDQEIAQHWLENGEKPKTCWCQSWVWSTGPRSFVKTAPSFDRASGMSTSTNGPPNLAWHTQENY
eukprot:1161147-Pelagomonas_calceolata.AAC.6